MEILQIFTASKAAFSLLLSKLVFIDKLKHIGQVFQEIVRILTVVFKKTN